MVRIIAVRHGESEGNLHGTFAGHTDVPLTVRGREQAMLTGQALRDVEFTAAYASPLRRAFETGELALAGRGPALCKEAALLEIDGGEWEGLPFDLLPERFPTGYALWHDAFGRACPDGGESVVHLSARVLAFARETERRHTGGTVLFATHATPIRMLRTASLGLPAEEAGQVPWPVNASYSVFEVRDGQIGCVEYSQDAHLSGMRTTLPGNI